MQLASTGPASTSRRGGALIASLLVVLTLSGVAAAVFSFSYALHREVGTQGAELRALYLAESGVTEALVQVAAAIEEEEEAPKTIGTEAAPLAMSTGRYWAEVTDNGDKTYTVRATGVVGSSRRTLEVVLEDTSIDLYDHAIFAGNSSGDPSYELRLAGKGKQADEIEGDVYSGGDVAIEQDAEVDGGVYATGTIAGAMGEEGHARAVPDLDAMQYEENHDFDVAAAFLKAATYASNGLGGKAWELPQEDPSHIFRKNPSDRYDEISGTAKDDYFLEDPHERVTGFSNAGDPGHTITLSGIPSEPGSTGTEKVYYIDGNLWVHNGSVLAMRLKHEGTESARVTFVVKGNVYFCDDLVLVNDQKDGLAFIAMEDEKVEDSGNIYFGDPRFGTLSEMHAWLYAENDFYDHNLSADGSTSVDIYGNMTAGNHVSIERDYATKKGGTVHSKLAVHFDDRISTGEIEMPGLPANGLASGSVQVVLWREAAEQ